MKNVETKAARNSRMLYPLPRVTAGRGEGYRDIGTIFIPSASSYNTPVRFRSKFGIAHGVVPSLMAALV